MVNISQNGVSTPFSTKIISFVLFYGWSMRDKKKKKEKRNISYISVRTIEIASENYRNDYLWDLDFPILMYINVHEHPQSMDQINSSKLKFKEIYVGIFLILMFLNM